MIRDLNRLAPEEGPALQKSFNADVCIAGAGAAGVTLARQLLARGHRVCLVESGDLDFDARTQSLYEGDNCGMAYYPPEEARLRFFGGTTNIWGGRCALLDPVDFESRPWVPFSQWPIGYGELLPWYRAAHDELGLGDFSYDDNARVKRTLEACGAHVSDLEDTALESRLWRFDTRPERFAWHQCRDILNAADALVLTRANVVSIEVDADASRATGFKVRSLEGRELELTAQYFVVACGGLENPRLLLLSNSVEPNGVGNGHDQVGRYFMEHPHGRIGRVHSQHAFTLWQSLRKRFPRSGPPLAPALALSAGEQAGREILNSAVTLKLQRNPALGLDIGKRAYLHLKKELNPTRSGRRAHRLYRAMRDWSTRTVTGAIKRSAASRGKLQLHLIIRGEQAPNPASRVTLGDRLDGLGCRQIAVNWQLSELDKRTAVALADAIDGELTRLGIGRVEKPQWLSEPGNEWPLDPTVSNHPIGGYHHMGTTRMSENPRDGVVDKDCRVHGYDNLFVAGSSVFATSGWANPTLTILALCHRLAATIDNRISAGKAPLATRSGVPPAD